MTEMNLAVGDLLAIGGIATAIREDLRDVRADFRATLPGPRPSRTANRQRRRRCTQAATINQEDP